MDDTCYLSQELKNNLHILKVDFQSLDLPTDFNGFCTHFRDPRNKIALRLLTLLFMKIDEARYMNNMNQLMLSFNRSNEIKIKKICMQWLSELSPTRKFSTRFSRFWSHGSPVATYPFLCWFSSLVVQKIYDFDYFKTILDENALLVTTEMRIQSVMTNLACIRDIEKKSQEFEIIVNEKSEKFKTILQTESFVISECFQRVNLENVNKDVSFQTLLDKLHGLQESQWSKVLLLKQSVSQAISEWSSMRTLFMDFIPLSHLSSADRCLDLSSMPNGSGSVDLVGLFKEGASHFQKAETFFCRGYEEFYPKDRIDQVNPSDFVPHTGPSPDLSWCILATDRATRDSSIVVDRKMRNLSLQNTIGSQLDIFDSFEGSSHSFSSAKLSSILDELIHSLKLLIADEEENWCHSSRLKRGSDNSTSADSIYNLSTSSKSPSLPLEASPPIVSNQSMWPSLISPGEKKTLLSSPERTVLRDLSFNAENEKKTIPSSPERMVLREMSSNAENKYFASKSLDADFTDHLDSRSTSFIYYPNAAPISSVDEKKTISSSPERMVLREMSSNVENKSFASKSFDADFTDHLDSRSTSFIYYPNAAPVSFVEPFDEKSSRNIVDSYVDFLDGDLSFTACLLPPSP